MHRPHQAGHGSWGGVRPPATVPDLVSSGRPAAPSARPAGPRAAASSPDGTPAPLADWMDSHRYVLGLWLDRLIETGDPDDLISMVHRQYAWLTLMREQIDPG